MVEKEKRKKTKAYKAHKDEKLFAVEGEPINPDSIFTVGRVAAPGGKEHLQHDTELLAMERAIMYPNHSVFNFLTRIKGYSITQARMLLGVRPATEWENAKERVLDAITANVVKRHCDQVAEVNDQHIKASKLAMARAVEMLTKLGVSTSTEYELDKDGNVKRDRMGKPIVKKSLRSIDLVNCTNAIKSAQDIYRRAMGLSNDEGIGAILERTQTAQNIQNNLHIHMQQQQLSPLEEALSKLSYEDVIKMIEAKREREAITVESQEVIDDANDENA